VVISLAPQAHLVADALHLDWFLITKSMLTARQTGMHDVFRELKVLVKALG
jgi:hypothetical protein